MPPTASHTPRMSCAGIALSISQRVSSGGSSPITETMKMHASTRASWTQYGRKNARMRRRSTRFVTLGRSGLNMLDHIKWTGGPPPNIVL